MKKIIYAILLLTITLSFGCKTNDNNLNIRVKDTETIFTYDAVYPVSKTEKLGKYIANQINSKLSLDRKAEASVGLVNGGQFKIKTAEGVLSIQFDKRNSSVMGYIKIKNFTNGISKILSEK